MTPIRGGVCGPSAQNGGYPDDRQRIEQTVPAFCETGQRGEKPKSEKPPAAMWRMIGPAQRAVKGRGDERRKHGLWHDDSPEGESPERCEQDDAREKPAPFSAHLCANQKRHPHPERHSQRVGHTCGTFVDAEDFHRSGKSPVKKRRFDKSGNSVVFGNQPGTAPCHDFRRPRRIVRRSRCRGRPTPTVPSVSAAASAIKRRQLPSPVRIHEAREKDSGNPTGSRTGRPSGIRIRAKTWRQVTSKQSSEARTISKSTQKRTPEDSVIRPLTEMVSPRKAGFL